MGVEGVLAGRPKFPNKFLFHINLAAALRTKQDGQPRTPWLGNGHTEKMHHFYGQQWKSSSFIQLAITLVRGGGARVTKRSSQRYSWKRKNKFFGSDERTGSEYLQMLGLVTIP